jgi:hypothetical protein
MSPAADSEKATVNPPPVTAVPFIEVVTAELAVVIAPPNTEIILIIFPSSGTAMLTELAADTSANLAVKK